MDELSSTEFRKRFARLTSPTVVTVNGHPIGTWAPVPGGSVTLNSSTDIAAGKPWIEVVPGPLRFNTAPFTPVPKRRG